MSLIKLAKSQEESKLSELDKIIKMIDEKTTQAKAPVIAQREQSKSRLNQINSEIRRQKINKDILKEIIDMRSESTGKAMVGNQPIPVSPDAQGLPLLESLANRR
jgi:CHASE3 domain sensor protein